MNVHYYYQRLIERGKHPLLVHNNIKNKMLHILVAMVRDRVKYNPDNVYRKSNEVNLARQSLLEARLSLIESHFQQIHASILLFKALGGAAPSKEPIRCNNQSGKSLLK